MQEKLEQRVVDWLKTQGYPLEMKVASAFRKEEFFVSQSSYYSDPETSTSREIDVIATKNDPIGFLEVAIVIECKSSFDKPWVLLTSERHEEGRNKFFTFGILSELAREKLVKCRPIGENRDDIYKLPWFNKPERTAFGVVASFSSGEDPAYKAVMGALKASIDYNRPEEKTSSSLRFIFPVVILEGRMFEAYLDSDGETIVKEIDEGFVTNHRSIGGTYCSSVHIVTTAKLAQFCKEATELTNQLEALLKPDLDAMFEELKQR